MEVSFSALIKSITIKSLISGDAEGQLILRFRPTEEIMNKLNAIYKPDEEVMIGIVRIEKCD